MSTETTDTRETVETETGQAVGSPPSGDPSAEARSGSGEPVSGKPENEGADEGSASSDEVARLRQEIAARDEKLAQAQGLIDQLDRDPEIVRFVQRRLAGGGETADGDNPVREFAKKAFGKVGDGWDEAMAGLAERIIEETERRLSSKLEGRIGSLAKTVNGTRLERSLTENGIDFETIRSPEFKALQKELRSDPVYRTAEEKRPESAARWLRVEWEARSKTRTANADQRERLRMGKTAKAMATTAPRGSGTAADSFTYDRDDPNRLSKLAEFLRNGGDRNNVRQK